MVLLTFYAKDGVGETFGRDQVYNANSAAYLVCYATSSYLILARDWPKDLLIGIDIGMLIALKSWPELGIHVRGALNNGLTEVEIREAILQATIYCGVPAGVEAMKVASKTVDEMVAKGEHNRQLAEVSPLVNK